MKVGGKTNLGDLPLFVRCMLALAPKKNPNKGPSHPYLSPDCKIINLVAE